MFFTILLFFIGFYILIKGANFLVDGASSLAKKFNISNFVIGLLIVGIGTSLPEFAISFLANLTDRIDVGLGTIIGSKIFNTLFILGLCSLFFPLVMKSNRAVKDLVWSILAVFLAIFFAITPVGRGIISRPEGFLMLVFFFLWVYLTIKKSNEVSEEQKSTSIIALPFTLLFILAGFVGVILGGKWVVDGAVVIARELGVSAAFVGLLIVGPSTSIPELAVSLVAVYRKQPGLAIGNIIGSNIFGFLMILGASALAKPILFNAGMLFHTFVALISAVLLFAAMFVGEKFVLKRWQGACFLLLFAVYILFLMCYFY